MVTGALWSDVDDDGWMDLLAATEYGPVRLLRNRAGSLSAPEAASPSGLWNGIAGADVDGDGDIDYAVTNLGLNTKYRASPERPLTLYHGSFEAGALPQIVEADWEGDRLLPVRGRSGSSQAMPSVAKRFGSFDAFARATLPEIYGAQNLEGATVLRAEELRSGILLNDGTGRFEFRALPRRAQVAPSFGVAAPDVDGDGCADLVLSQNFFTPQPETPRMDGGVGLLLLGRGDGTFDPVRPDRSGLLIPGDAKALVAADFNGDGRPDVAATQNDGDLLLFENRGEGRFLTVRLKGLSAGARVTLTCDDGVRATAEVYAGSGYLSQSAGSLRFGLGALARPASLMVRWRNGYTDCVAVPPASGEILVIRGE